MTEHAEPTSSPDPATPAVELTDVEARIVGCLIEKEATTPDVYPLTTKSIVTACNQKTNRDPVVDYGAVLVDSALLELRQKKVVRMVHTPGARSTKHRHTLDEALALSPGETALIAVLLLRGDQTVGELRGRTERLHGFEALSDVERTLEGLAQRRPALVVHLDRRPGQKEARWRHLLFDEEATAARGSAPEAPVESAVSAAPSAAAVAPRLHAVEPTTPDDGLAGEVTRLRRDLDALQARFDALCLSLGEDPDPT